MKGRFRIRINLKSWIQFGMKAMITHLRLALPSLPSARPDKILSASIVQSFFFSQGDSIEEYTLPILL
jgi:hypothetical protein